MTDRDIALALGDYINNLLAKIEALRTLIPDYQEDDLKRIMQDPAFRRISDGQSSALLHAIGDKTQASDLIHALGRNYFQT
jgi:hypothetical protein